MFICSRINIGSMKSYVIYLYGDYQVNTEKFLLCLMHLKMQPYVWLDNVKHLWRYILRLTLGQKPEVIS